MSGNLHRRITGEVMAGHVGIGGNNPVRVQSMTSTPTSDTVATVEQIMRIAGAGAEIARMTVQSIREAGNLANIKSELRKRECFIPLVADVHFNPAIAEKAAAIVEKVRINPGNYGIARSKDAVVLSDKAYRQELSEARDAFLRLLDICRDHGTALRIGVNHGSLSPRIINRYGNTPEGMVISAMEFLRFCDREGFRNVVVSIKSSNTRVMVQANRLMVDYMDREGMDYPLHLGVTEAGEGEDGRIRSVAGIGTLLAEGIGDTIRVSLTEEPEKEVPVAAKLLVYAGRCWNEKSDKGYAGNTGNAEYGHDGGHQSFVRPGGGRLSGVSGGQRQSFPVMNIGGNQVPVVIGEIDAENGVGDNDRGIRSADVSSGHLTDIQQTSVADYLFVQNRAHSAHRTCSSHPEPDMMSGQNTGVSEKITGRIIEASLWQKHCSKTEGCFPLAGSREYLTGFDPRSPLFFLGATVNDLTDELLKKAATDKRLVFVALSRSACPSREMRNFAAELDKNGCTNPVIFKKDYSTGNIGDFQIEAAAGFAPLFIDGIGDGIWIVNRAPGTSGSSVPTAFNILQSARARITRTEFISCPSCGRTMFNIRKATAAVKKRISHLRGLKIAVMGCIVNGPGEMADADYGYVGSGRGKVSLYKKQSLVMRNVPEDKAIEELIGLIREGGDWIDR